MASSSSSSSFLPSSIYLSSSSKKKRLWSWDEDKILIDCVRKYGAGNWNEISRISGLLRDGYSCRFRWMNHLKPGINRESFTEQEDNVIIKAREFYGNQWSNIASKLPRRTDNQVKNRWNSYLSKKESMSLSDENGRSKHSESQPNIPHELFPNYEFHPDFSNEFFHQNLSPKPFLENEFNKILFYKHFAEYESYQYLPHEPLHENELYQDFIPEVFPEHQYLSCEPFRENEFHQDCSHEPFLENEFHQDFSHKPFPENEFHLWDFSSAFSW